MPNSSTSSLISHCISTETLDLCVQKITERIMQQGDKPYVSVKYQLDLLQQLREFDFGKFLICHQGINGYWTNYMLTYPWHKNEIGHQLSPMERFILERAPIMLATQQRFEIFLQCNQKEVKEKAVLACIPCGMMGELLYLDYKTIHSIQLVGVDYDDNALNDAKLLAEEKKLMPWVTLEQGDAWQLKAQDAFDLISCNGLTIYEPNDLKLMDLYQLFYKTLKSGGKLVTSFLTPPPMLAEHCEWNLSKINEEHLLLQKIIFVDILDAKFQCYRSSLQTKKLLESAGFKQIEFVNDDARLFPTVMAYK